MTQPEASITQPPKEGEEKLTCIYALVDPRDWRPFYVGKANSPNKRLGQHTGRSHASSGQNARKKARIDAIKSAGLSVSVEVIEMIKMSIWEEREKYWIAEFRRIGFDITNLSDGGNGLDNHMKAAKLAMSLARKGKKRPPEACRNISLGKMGGTRSPEHRKSISDTLRGRKNPEHSKRMSGRKASAKTIAAMSAAMKHSSAATEQIKRLKLANKGKPKTQAHRESTRSAKFAFAARVKVFTDSGKTYKEACGLARKRK